jgi:hypothetical protein
VNRIAYWDVGGSAMIEEDQIILVPPIQYRTGYAENAPPLPYGKW